MIRDTLPERDQGSGHKSFTILVADDDRGIRESLRDVLADRGFDVSLAGSGEEAVEIAQVQMLHLVLCDMHMPRMTGLEALTLIRQMYDWLPALLMTADASSELLRQAFQAQIYSVIPKPVNLTMAMHTLTRALDQAYGPGRPREPH